MSRLRLAGALATALALTACSGGGGGSDSSGSPDASTADFDTSATLRYAVTAGVTSFDPHKTRLSSDFTLLNFVYDRLVHRDITGSPVPGLAESWELAPDGSTLTLTLREGLTFSDGTPFDSEAVRLNLLRAKEPDSISSALLAPVGSIDTPDATTVVLNLTGPGAQLPLTLSDLAGMMVSPQAFATPEAAAALAQTPVGIGRFTLTDSEPGARYSFAASEDYWDADALRLAGLEISVISDSQALLNGVESGQTDCGLANPEIIDAAMQIPDVWTEVATTLTESVLYFNSSSGELANPAARQAISYAIDREAILAAAQEGHGEAATQLFPEGYFAHSEELADRYAPDPDKARDLLEEAGRPDGFTFRAIVLGLPQFVTTAQIIQQQLAEVGITMELDTRSPAEAGVSFARGEADAVVTAWTGRPDPSNLMTAYFAPTSPQNPSRSTPDGFLEALAAADAIADPEEGGAALAEASQIVLDDARVVPLTFNDVGAFCSTSVAGYEPTVNGVSEFRGVGITTGE
ncbi:ABC transporter substrate-binding protein [Blastococcus sp. SYSU D00820]